MEERWAVYLKVLALIAAAEAAVMLVGALLVRTAPGGPLLGKWGWLADSLLLTAFVSPFLYHWIVREWDRRREAEKSSRLLNLLARSILESPDLTTALDFTLREICEIAGWVYGEAWVPSADGKLLELHSGSPQIGGILKTFIDASNRFKFAEGVGLPGRAWSTAKPVWIPDVTVDPDFPRKALARAAGLKGALAIPVLAEHRVTLVLAFYIRETRPGVDERMVELISGGASQLGSLIERKRAEDERQRLSETNEIKNRLLGIAAHDLRNPLTIMVGHVALLQEEAVDASRKRQLSIVQRKCQQMLTLIDGMLDSSIIESRGLLLDLQSLDLGELLEQLCADGRLLAEDKAIGLKLQLEPGLPALTADRARLQQVFDNLIGNAVKYSPPGRTVAVTARAAGNAVEVAVSDEGPGIPAGDLPRLFKEFGRAQTRTTGGERSVGLGLSIAHRLVQAHDGTIRVESAPGAGATFTVSLPLHRQGKSAPAVDLR